MRFSIPEIDAGSGRLMAFEGLTIGAATRLQDFPADDFRMSEERRDGVAYTWVRPRENPQAGGCTFDLMIGFADGRPFAVFLTIVPPEHAAMSDDAYYASGEQRHAYHRDWLRQRLGERKHFSWGEAEARWERRSEGVAIRILYREDLNPD